jgi:hypothetical protein
MCDRCVEVDDKINHYKRIAASITDQTTLDRIKQVVAEMKAEKASLHPGQE